MLSTEQQIIEAEARLRSAMLTSDVEALNQLIADDLIFTSHVGQIVSKQDDLAFHRAGIFRFESIEPSEQQIKIVDGLAIVSVRVQLVGVSGESPFETTLRYTRIWRRNDTWQIVAGHSSIVQEEAYFSIPEER